MVQAQEGGGMTRDTWAMYIREELAEYTRTGCPRALAELRESFRRYGRTYRPARDWAAV